MYITGIIPEDYKGETVHSLDFIMERHSRCTGQAEGETEASTAESFTKDTPDTKKGPHVQSIGNTMRPC